MLSIKSGDKMKYLIKVTKVIRWTSLTICALIIMSACGLSIMSFASVNNLMSKVQQILMANVQYVFALIFIFGVLYIVATLMLYKIDLNGKEENIAQLQDQQKKVFENTDIRFDRQESKMQTFQENVKDQYTATRYESKRAEERTRYALSRIRDIEKRNYAAYFKTSKKLYRIAKPALKNDEIRELVEEYNLILK